MFRLNKVLMAGRFTADPELRQTPNGKSVVRATLAVPRGTYGDRKNETDFFQLVIWGKQAEFVAKYFSKGSAAYVEGEERNNNYTDKNDVKHYGNIIEVKDIQFGENKANANSAAARGEPVQAAPYQPNTAVSQTFDSFDGFEEIGDGEEAPF